MSTSEARLVPDSVLRAWQDAPAMRRFVAVLGVSLGCSPAVRSPSEASVASTHVATVPAGTAAPSAAVSTSAPASASVAPPEAAPHALSFSFVRVETSAVSSLAPGKPPKIAALGAGEVFVFDGTRLSRLSLAETVHGELSIEIFFGRDDQPRLMGHRRPSGGNGKQAPYYRRFKAGRFQPEPSELGPLAAPEGALYGVLGHADPEVVCRPGQFCLVKRITGWTRAPAHSEPVRVVLAGESAWALHRDRIERLERDGWVALTRERPWDEPSSISQDSSGSVWVVEAKSNAVTRLANGRFEAISTPLEGPRAIWAAASNDAWLVGTSGAAHFDGTTWTLVPGVSGPLASIVYSPPNLWLAGGAGLFRGTPVNAP